MKLPRRQFNSDRPHQLPGGSSPRQRGRRGRLPPWSPRSVVVLQPLFRVNAFGSLRRELGSRDARRMRHLLLPNVVRQDHMRAGRQPADSNPGRAGRQPRQEQARNHRLRCPPLLRKAEAAGRATASPVRSSARPGLRKGENHGDLQRMRTGHLFCEDARNGEKDALRFYAGIL